MSTSTLNSKNLYELLIKLQRTDQLKIQNECIIGEFFTSSKEIEPLLQVNVNNNNYGNNGGTLNAELNSCLYNHQQVVKSADECQELCCLLKFNQLDNFEIVP